ncbi:MAG: tRNA (guanosine(37)-N1)-methyltransferase TrmD [Nitrospirae bacterium]|uniref:tRNA (guanosine(37)-N1)-methyltransferase TrmD n=1 Tax=Candidatus Magnetobacterium casense TaxID=1455061 RepID=UPI00058D7D7C|nr:tRNA (guanosine(37)-N1)-methyltransferase TrmD [Candidatus Magnetobacterium casensis]MBF0337960.1 tRNA (guanosine(37)-N1)-methyltransferase TrmD [Nitrospirota bacterium]
MKIEVLTIFPDMILSYMTQGMMTRAIQKGLVDLSVTNIRDFASDKARTVDDYPYGGGPGMVMKIAPVFDALQYLHADGTERHVILTTPQGRVFDQTRAQQLATHSTPLTFICGRYEGIDERVLDLVNEEISIGDYVLTGGELPALVIIDAIVRLIPGVLGDSRSGMEDSFSSGYLDCPHYTRPEDFHGRCVPPVLLSGNHKEINRWRKKQAIKKTLKNKPYLLNMDMLTQEEHRLLTEIKEEIENEPG